MSVEQSTTRSVGSKSLAKPAKPYPEFPLYAHATKRWAKKIRGKVFYFGKWDDPFNALQEYQEVRDDLFAGRTPRQFDPDAVTVRQLCNVFLGSKRKQVDAGDLSETTWKQYKIACRRMVEFFGGQTVAELRPHDFERFREDIAKTNGPTGIRNNVNIARMVFKYAYEAELVDIPVRFGPHFKRPPARVIRRQKRSKMLTAAELRTLIDASAPSMSAMLHLGVNCGFIAKDISQLQLPHIRDGWVTLMRNKTGSDRRIPLWPETLAAIDEYKRQRKPQPGHTSHLFLTQRGVAESEGQIGRRCRELMTKVGVHQPGFGFATFRHVFQTVAGETTDQICVDAIMGHESGHSRNTYREGISDERFQRVVDHVRGWLYAN